MVDHHRKAGSEPRGLLRPVADDRHRTDQQCGTRSGTRLPLALNQRQGLDGLAQPHIVGEASAEAPAAKEAEPGVTACLVGSQGPLEACRWFEQLEGVAPLEPFEEASEPTTGLDALECQAARWAGRSQDRA